MANTSFRQAPVGLLAALSAFLLLSIQPLHGHEWHRSGFPAPGPEREALRLHLLQDWTARQSQTGQLTYVNAAAVFSAQARSIPLMLVAASASNQLYVPQPEEVFKKFPNLQLRRDGNFLYVGSNGLPDHNMMVGISAWQQQVPLPQNYFGDNAWRIPLSPVPAQQPSMIKGRFLRGAIAIAVNGIPIFNPQNNRGEISYEIGELDQWGGHCGRADDYHYHIAPLHLQAQVGKGMPVAYALDGYPVYGLTEPDGSPVTNLDGCHGHETPGIGYHYHASNKYPYVLGGFHGEIVEREGQADPQPRAQGVREALTALRGARITAFESTGKDSYKLSYEVNGDKRSISYAIKSDGTYPFHFDNGSEGSVDEVYTARRQGGGGGRPPADSESMKGEGKGQGQGKGGREGEMRRDAPAPPLPPEESDRPPRPQIAIEGILDVNGDGVVTAQEFADHAKSNASKKGLAIPEAMATAKRQFTAFDHNHDGKLDTPELGELADDAPATGDLQPRRDAPPVRDDMKNIGGGERRGKGKAFVALPDQPRSSDGKFMLRSPVVEDLQALPTEFTGDGEGISPPLQWSGNPVATESYALIMDHVSPEGDRKWYWTLYDIRASVSSLPKNVTDIGALGTGFKGDVGYEPPHSKGPGAKTYVITLYALSAEIKVAGKPGREELISAMKGKVLAHSSLRVIHSSAGVVVPQPRSNEPKEGPQTVASPRTPPAPIARPNSPGDDESKKSSPGGGTGKGRGKGGPPGLIKPSIADTMKLNVYADNWFMLYINGRLVAVDSIQFTPHNVVSVDFLPEYPMTIAVVAKDNADPKTGLEYGTTIGDGGFCLKFADGTVTNANWKAKNFFHGPINRDTAHPEVKQETLPADWWAVDFDDSTWKNAKEYTVEEVDPKQPYFENDFDDAKFIWSDDIALDNTVIFRIKVEKPGWTPRWNTRPDLDVTGAPQR